MDSQQLKRVPVFGIILVVLGVGLLLRQLRIIHLDGSSMLLFGLIAYGGTMIIRSFVTNVRQSLFFGSLCFYSGIVLLLGKYGFMETTPFTYVPGFLIAFGLSFSMLFIFTFSEYHLLVPAIIFIGLGTAFMMTEIGFLYPSDIKDAIRTYWPVAIILFGVLMLFSRKEKKI